MRMVSVFGRRPPQLSGAIQADQEGDSMRFNPKARLDRSRVRDTGGGGGGGGVGGGGMRITIPGGTKAGGGLGGLLIIILFVVLTQCTGLGTQGGPSLPNYSLNTSRIGGADTGRYDNCQTGADAN